MTIRPAEADYALVLERTEHLWEPLRGERIFVTGGTGFVGTWFLEALAAANAALRLRTRAIVLTREPSRFRARSPHLAADDAIELLRGNAADFDAPAGTFAFVVHAATERSFVPDRERPLGMLAADRAATERVLEFAATHGTKRMLFTSSGAVYGPSRPGAAPFSETCGFAPDTLDERAAYGESKRLSEYACGAYARAFGFEAIVARLFAFVGPLLPLDEGYAVGNFLADAIAGRDIRINGDGTAVRSYLYAADLAIWLWTLLLRGRAGRAYNVGSPHAITIGDLARLVAKTLAPHVSVRIEGNVSPGAAPSVYLPDTTRAQSDCGLEAWTPLDEALRRTFVTLAHAGRSARIT